MKGAKLKQLLPNTSEQTLFFGLGAPRAGTTWLFNYLTKHPQCRLSNIKEMHYFDLFASNQPDKLLSRIDRIKKRAEAAQARGVKGVLGYSMQGHLKMIDEYTDLVRPGARDVDGYIQHLRSRAKKKKVFGEITPSYGTLSEQVLRDMHGAWPRTRMIFLMRDPVARLWSWVRLSAEKSAAEGVEAETAYAIDNFKKIVASGKNARSDYRGTIQRLTAAVPAEDVHYVFYEDMFAGGETSEQCSRDICAFLGIDPIPAKVSKPKNKAFSAKIPDDLARDALAFLQPQYEFVGSRFGRLPEKWEKTLQTHGSARTLAGLSAGR